MRLKLMVLCSMIFSFSYSLSSQTTKFIESDSIFYLLQEKGQNFPKNTQLSIGIIEDSTVHFYGVIYKEDTIQWVENHNKVFEIASITKVFTSTLLAQLAIEESLKLDDNIQNHLDFRLKSPLKITFKQLANHTSGLPTLPSNMNALFLDASNPYKNYTEKKLLKYLIKKIKLKSIPGESSEYSNLGSALLGYVLTKHTGKSYENLLQEYIFSKYNMSQSSTQRHKIKGEIIQGQNKKGKITPYWDFDVLVGAGGIYSSVEDLSKFALEQFDTLNKSTQLTQVTTHIISEKSSVGLGWNIVEATNKSKKVIWHNGGTGGFSSCIALDVVNMNGIIVLSNLSSFHKNSGEIDKICFGLFKNLQQNN